MTAAPLASSAPAASPAASDELPRRRRRQRQLSLVDDVPRPVVKWAGGKTKILGELLSRMPASFGRYIEPFAGGAALFFRALPARAILGDSNADLMELYAQVADDPVGLHGAARALFDRHAADPDGTFYGGRLAWNQQRRRWTPQARAALFLYLNKACFNGLFRLNKKGILNVPIGRQAGGPSCPSIAQLTAAQSALRGVSLRSADYVEVIAEAERGDFVYLDPPYLPTDKTPDKAPDETTDKVPDEATEKTTKKATKKTIDKPRDLVAGGDDVPASKTSGSSPSFTSYTEDGFGVSDHEELARHARALVDRGVLVMASNADVTAAHDLYRGFQLASVLSPRSINSKGGGRGKVGEMIAIGGYAPSGPRSPGS